MMTQNTEQNVRTQSLQIAEIVERATDLSLVNCYPDFGEVQDWMIEAEARGAEEQRRKDAEGQEAVAWESPYLHELAYFVPQYSDEEKLYWKPDWRALYGRPANVAALEARIAELVEAEQFARADAEASKARVEALEEALEYLLEAGDRTEPGRPRILDLAYTAFMSGALGKNQDDGGKCDWFNDTRPKILRHIEAARAALTREGGV